MGWFFWLALCVVLFFIIIKLHVKLSTGWCRSQVCLVGKTVIVTGANTGIGYETAIDLAKRGARVILACRDENKAKDAVKKIIKETDNPNVLYKTLDLSSLKSVRRFAEEIKKTEPKLDILINNAGAYGLEGDSKDGLNLEMQVNYFGPFLLTNLLLDLLKKSSPSRIVNVSSMVAKRNTRRGPLDVNNLNDCHPLHRTQLRSTNVTTYSLHPGVIFSDLFRGVSGFWRIFADMALNYIFKSSLEGAQTTIYCAVQKGIEELSGEHFEDCHYVKRYKVAQDEGLSKRLWENTEKLVKLKAN